MADVHAFGLHAGAQAFQQLLRDLHTRSEADLEAYGRVHPDYPVGVDPRDYRALSQMLAASIDRNLNHADAARREGYLRALTDLLCIQVDGCVPDFDDWNPIKNTAQAFGEARHG